MSEKPKYIVKCIYNVIGAFDKLSPEQRIANLCNALALYGLHSITYNPKENKYILVFKLIQQ